MPWHTKSIRFIVKLLLSLIDFSITYQLGVREAFSHRGKGKKEEMDIFLPWHTKSIRFIVKLLLSLIDFSITYQLGVREAFSHRGKGKKEEMDIFFACPKAGCFLPCKQKMCWKYRGFCHIIKGQCARRTALFCSGCGRKQFLMEVGFG